MPVTITATFAEIKFKKKRLMIKNIVKLEITHYTGKYRGAVPSICNLKHNAPKEVPVFSS